MNQNIDDISPNLKKVFVLPFTGALLLALFAGAIFSFSLAPYHHWYLAIISPALLYFALHQHLPKRAFCIGFAYGFGLWFVGTFWLYTSIHVYGLIPAPLAVLMVALMACIMALFSAVQALIYRKYFSETALTFAPLWIIFEWLKTWLFTGFPWLFVGYAFIERFLDSYAPVFGVLGVSFVAVVLGCAIVELCRKRWIWLVSSGLLIVLAWALSFVNFTERPSEMPLSVSLIQGNIPQDQKWLQENFHQTLQIYTELSKKEWGRDLVVWPESAITAFQTDIPEFLDSVSALAQSNHSSWLTGIFYLDTENHKKYNSIIALGESRGEYHKQRLVPFGEYIPLSGLLYWVLPEMQKDVANGGLSAGDTKQIPLSIKARNLAVAICYEVAYPNLTRQNAKDSDFLLTISNDAWFTGTAGPWQHLQMVQMRAKENGRWFIRATNTGITVFIDEQGRIVQQVPQDVQAVLRGDLPRLTGRTLYNRWGDYPILLLVVILLSVPLYSRLIK